MDLAAVDLAAVDLLAFAFTVVALTAVGFAVDDFGPDDAAVDTLLAPGPRAPFGAARRRGRSAIAPASATFSARNER